MANSPAQITARYANDHHDIKRIAIELMQAESQIPIASQATSRRFATRLALFYGTLFGLVGTHLPFFPVWLKAVGIDASWIGIITAVPSVTRFTILPVVTGLAERRGSLRGAMIVTAFVTALGFCVIGTQYQAFLVLLVYAVTCCLWTPMVPLTDAYALKGVARYGLNYGPLRLWGSAAFVVGALACGLLVDVITTRHLIWVIAAVAGLGAAASLGLRPLDQAATAPAARHGASALLRKPGFLAIILAAALIQGSHAAYYTFASITWQGAGMGGLTIAGLWVLGVLAEIVVFALSPRFTLQPSLLVVIGALSAVARWLITAQEPTVPVFAVVQLAHGLTFGLTQVGTMLLLARHVPGHVMARGQGYYAGCSGIVTSSASILSGAIYARYGQGVYYVMAAMALSGALVMWLARHRLAFSSEMEAGSPEENASKREDSASVLIQSEPKSTDHPHSSASDG
jgi:PPP family 3-phenylpropionic acid transporter